MDSIEQFLSSTTFFIIMVAIMVVLIITFIIVIITNRKKKVKKNPIVIDESAEIQLVKKETPKVENSLEELMNIPVNESKEDEIIEEFIDPNLVMVNQSNDLSLSETKADNEFIEPIIANVEVSVPDANNSESNKVPVELAEPIELVPPTVPNIISEVEPSEIIAVPNSTATPINDVKEFPDFDNINKPDNDSLNLSDDQEIEAEIMEAAKKYVESIMNH